MSDLISRQNALDALKEYEVVESDNFTKTDPISMMTVATIANCIEVIWKLPSAEPERKWTPVSEALPKVRTDVLLAFEKNMAVGFYSHGCWNVNTGNGFYTGVFTDEDKPIAWMPLPEPAKIGDGK